MNIIQQQDALKNLPDHALQNELLRPTGAVPPYLALTELQRRKDMRNSFAAMQKQPSSTIAEEFARGLGGADVGNYPDAVRGSMPGAPSSPMGEQGPPMGQMPQQSQPQGFASGGAVEGDFRRYAGVGPQTMLPSGRPLLPNAMIGASPYGLSGQLAGNATPPAPAPQAAPQGLAAVADPMAAMGISGADGGTGPSGVGGNADAASTGAEGSSADGTLARGGLVRYADGGQVDDSIWWPSVRRYKDMMSRRNPGLGSYIQQLGNPDDPTGRSIPDPEISAGSGWPVEPGYSPGETIARRLQGRSSTLPPNAGAPGDDAMVTSLRGGQGYAGTEPTGLPSGGQGYAGPDPSTSMGDDNANTLQAGPGPQGGPRGLAAAIPGQGNPAGGGAGGRSGGGGALGNTALGNGSLADYMGQVRGLALPDRYGELEAQSKTDRDKLQSNISSDKGLALLQAGLGIMGGTSPFASVNIGQGGQKGIKYWEEAQREVRLAEQGIRNAENQIAIAKANRDEKQLDTGLRMYERAQEAQQRAADRANAAGIASADRQTRMDLMSKELESKAADRVDLREQSRINEFGVAANRYTTAADALDMKAATLSANPLATSDPNAQAQIAGMQQQAKSLREQADNYGKMHQQSIIDREVRAGRLASPADEEAYKKLKPGTRYVAPDGSLRVKPNG